MPTNTRATTARRYHHEMVHYLRRDITYADKGKTISVGILPDASIILPPSSGVVANVAFNNGTTNTIDIGTSADSDLYGTALTVGSIAFVPLDEAVSRKIVGDTEIFVTVGGTGTAATAGEGSVIIAYIPNNDPALV